MRLGFCIFLFCFVSYTHGQVFWSENFGLDSGVCANQGQLASSYSSVNGFWSINQTGVNSAQANVWYVSATEAGLGAAGICGNSCLNSPELINQTLHVSTSILGDLGAAYLETGFNFTNSDIRVESPIIDCSGQTGISLSFLYMAAGSATDVCSVTYFDGTFWTNLGDLAPTPNTCESQGTWSNATFNLPASADNNPNVRLGYRWVNFDDGVASDPSVAIDDIALIGNAGVGELVANFSASQNVICVGDCVDFTNLTTGAGQFQWNWTFEGSETTLSFNENPINVCYSTLGSYDVTLQITGPGGVTELTIPDYITVIDTCGPIVGFIHTPIVCSGQCYSFENTSIGGTNYFWEFQGATPSTSTDENPQNICYLGFIGNLNVVLTVTNEFGVSSSMVQPVMSVNPPPVNAGTDQTIPQGTSTSLSAIGGDGTGTFLWQPSEYVTCSSCPSTIATPPVTTEFIVFYQEAGGCQSSDTVIVFVNDVTSTGIESINGEISIHPNPFSTQLILNFEQVGNYDLFIYSANGKLMQTELITSKNFELNTESWSNGLFLIQAISNDTGESLTYKVVKTSR